MTRSLRSSLRPRRVLRWTFGLVAFAAAVAGPAQDLIVYDDALRNGFLDYSYGVPADFDFASTVAVHSGAASIAFVGDNFNAVSFARPGQSVATSQYPTLHFWVHGGAVGGQKLRLYLQNNSVIVAQAPLDSYIAGGALAAGSWREVTVTLGQAPLSYSGSFDRIDLQSDVSGGQPVLYLDDVVLLAGGGPAPNRLQVEHDVTVDAMVSDRFTWRDAADHPRVAVLAHNDGQLGPTVGYPNHGGALRQFQYRMPDASTRVAGTTDYGNGGYGGFGYVVSHRGDGTAGIGGADDSPLGYAYTGAFARVFEGRHHAIFRFTQLYPRYSSTTANPPNHPYNVPVTIDWIFATGRDNPVWAVTWDLSGVPVDALNDDSRAPYGELNIDGQGFADVDGAAWGDRYKFTSTTAPVTLDSGWTWNLPNTVPYVKLWIASTDATMGTVLTQTMSQQDAGGGRNPFYHDVTPYWGKTSADGNAGGVDVMPWQDSWPYQANSFSIGPAPNSNNNARLTWGTQYGFLGQASYGVHDGVVPSAPGWPKKSYSDYIVLGPHSALPVEAQVAQVETVQSLTLSAAVGSVATSGPAGVARADTVTYAPPGYNHIYGALAFAASGNALDANIAVGAGTLRKPLVIVSGYSAGYPLVKLGGVTMVSDVDFFPSLRPSAGELWITLNRDLAGAANHFEVSGVLPSAVPSALSVDAGAASGTSSNTNGVLEAGETVLVAPSWRNTTAGTLGAFSGSGSNPSGPPGASYALPDAAAGYAGVASGASIDCAANCYQFSVSTPAARPAPHWDASFDEALSTSETATWILHVGGSFADTPASSGVYRFVETLLHRGVTAGCGGGDYCPASNVSRQQMAVFLLVSREGAGYAPPACGAPIFGDVPCASGFAPWVNELSNRGVTAGCGGGNYCPGADVTRAQMAVFLLRTLEGNAYAPPACVVPVFGDVPCASGFAVWINELAGRGVTAGCGGGNYCPASPVTRGQMAVFLTTTFDLTLYGP